jgi:hypothetical protein
MQPGTGNPAGRRDAPPDLIPPPDVSQRRLAVSQVLRFSACTAVVAVFLTVAGATRPVLLRDLGLNIWEWPGWQRNLDSQVERKQELMRRWQVSERRDQMKSAICRDLLAGRLTLREAARRFEELPEPSDHLQEDLRFQFPQGTDEERMCLHVLLWAGDLTGPPSADGVEPLRRLREEFQAAFGRLPDRA